MDKTTMMKDSCTVLQIPRVKLSNGEEHCPTCDGYGMLAKLSQDGKFSFMYPCHECKELGIRLKDSEKSQKTLDQEEIERERSVKSAITIDLYNYYYTGPRVVYFSEYFRLNAIEHESWFPSFDRDADDGYFFKPRDFFNVWHMSKCDEQGIRRPKYFYAVISKSLSVDAKTMIAEAADKSKPGYGPNMENKVPFGSVAQLQGFIDMWLELYLKQKPMYFKNLKVGIIIPWEDYDDEGSQWH